MGGMQTSTAEQLSRLHRIRENLRLATPVDSPEFEKAVVQACRIRVDSLLTKAQPCTGEHVLSHLANQLHVRFEEVNHDRDIARLEKKYLEDKREIGFGQLEIELNAPGVDALLFQRIHTEDVARDRWVAVLNLRDSRSRAYWSRAHELTHRVAEPAQQQLPFYRHRNDSTNRLESLVDLGAAELAFYPPLFRPIVDSISTSMLTWGLVEEVRSRFASTASRLSTVHAMLRYWPQPTYLVFAQIAGRKGQPNVDRSLRIKISGFSTAARDTFLFFPNMRVPETSPIWHAFYSGKATSDFEQLGRWQTSSGKRLPDIRVFSDTNYYHYGNNWVYALVSLV